MSAPSPTALQALAVAAGSVGGALLRWITQTWLNPVWSGFPLGTLAVNGGGGFMIGLALAWFAQTPNDLLRLLVITGFLGGLTTFSSFSGESLAMLQRGEFGMALLHTLAHVLGSLACAALGFAAMRHALS